MAPTGSPLKRYAAGVELTDCRTVALHMIRMARVGVQYIDNLADASSFVRAVHVTGDLEKLGQGTPDDKRYFVTFADERTILHFGSSYGGNALLGKIAHGLRQAAYASTSTATTSPGCASTPDQGECAEMAAFDAMITLRSFPQPGRTTRYSTDLQRYWAGAVPSSGGIQRSTDPPTSMGHRMTLFIVVTTITGLVIAAATLWVSWRTKRRQAGPGQHRCTGVRLVVIMKFERMYTPAPKGERTTLADHRGYTVAELRQSAASRGLPIQDDPEVEA
jgi:hypothetical protein